MLRRHAPLVLALLVTLLLPIHEACAYLDPGSGSALLQVLLAGFAGVAVAGKMFCQYLFHWLRRKPEVADEQSPSD